MSMSTKIDHNDAMNYVNNACKDLTVNSDSQDAAHGALQEWLIDNDNVDEYIVHSSILTGVKGNIFVRVVAVGTDDEDKMFQFHINFTDVLMYSEGLVLIAPGKIGKNITSAKKSATITHNPKDAYNRAMKGIS